MLDNTNKHTNKHTNKQTDITHQFQEALRCGIVVSPLVCQVDLAHLVHTAMSEGHELADGVTQLRLKRKRERETAGEKNKIPPMFGGRIGKGQL